MDERLFSAALGAIYAAASAPAPWPEALQAVADVSADEGAILVYARDDGRFGVITSHSLQAMVHEYVQSWSHQDMRAIRARERGFFFHRRVITDRDVVTPEEMESDPYYADFLARHGLRYFAAASISPDPHIDVAISVQRRADRNDYSESELDTLGEIVPHVESALRLSIRLLDADLVKNGLADALARIDIGVFALDSLGRAIYSNELGKALLGDGLGIVDHRLVVEGSPSRQEFEAAVRQVIKGQALDTGGRVKPIVVDRNRRGRPIVLYVLPITNTWTSFLSRARVCVLARSSGDGAPDPTIVRDVLGITLGEARVAALIGSGETTQSAAAKLGISNATARTVLKRVFAKAGVSRQSELTALLGKLVLR